MFFSIYGERDKFDYAEPATRQVATRGVQRHGSLDLVVIAGQLSQTIAGVTELGSGDDRMAWYISSTPSTCRTVTISMATAREICA